MSAITETPDIDAATAVLIENVNACQAGKVRTTYADAATATRISDRAIFNRHRPQWGDHETVIESSDLIGDDAYQCKLWEELTGKALDDAPLELTVLVYWDYVDEAVGDRPPDWRHTLTRVTVKGTGLQLLTVMSDAWVESMEGKL